MRGPVASSAARILPSRRTARAPPRPRQDRQREAAAKPDRERRRNREARREGGRHHRAEVVRPRGRRSRAARFPRRGRGARGRGRGRRRRPRARDRRAALRRAARRAPPPPARPALGTSPRCTRPRHSSSSATPGASPRPSSASQKARPRTPASAASSSASEPRSPSCASVDHAHPAHARGRRCRAPAARAARAGSRPGAQSQPLAHGARRERRAGDRHQPEEQLEAEALDRDLLGRARAGVRRQRAGRCPRAHRERRDREGRGPTRCLHAQRLPGERLRSPEIARFEDVSSSLAPTFLVAMPQLLDPNFRRAVVLLVHHDEEGTFGIVLNRSTEITAPSLCATLDIAWHGAKAEPIGWGGPVQPQTGWVLFDDESDHGYGDEVKLVADRRSLRRLARRAAADRGRASGSTCACCSATRAGAPDSSNRSSRRAPGCSPRFPARSSSTSRLRGCGSTCCAAWESSLRR